ncbi:MAG: hypothetical protein HKN37_04925 [Rhodothermales bacterium]|nr:hypothetical protein [Rhodothermales bacterium]
MSGRIRRRFRFFLEHWIQRGALHQLLLMMTLVVLVALLGGLLAFIATNVFGGFGEAAWWAFLRLTDPGYLGDDEGTVLRSISTAVTVAGYVLFMGSLIAIMTAWLNKEIRNLESGLTPISIQDHFLILGWTNRTPSILRELVLSEGRVRRYLRRRGVRRLKIVILADEVGSGLRQEILNVLGGRVGRVSLVLRSGSSMRIEHLQRVDFARASAIIIPGADFELGGPEATDTRVVKTLMSISRHGVDEIPGETLPAVVAEIFDAQKVPIAMQVYDGPINIIAGDAFISRLIAQTVRHRGLSHVYGELLSHEHGNEVYVRYVEEFDGLCFADVIECFSEAVVLGVVRPEGRGFEPILNPPANFAIEKDDSIVLIADSYERTLPDSISRSSPMSAEHASRTPASIELQPLRRLLVLGWSHKVSALLHELVGYPNERFALEIFSLVDIARREQELNHLDIPPDRVLVTHTLGDYTRPSDLQRIDWDSYDNVVFLGSDWLDSSVETDARTILGYSAVRATLGKDDGRTDILVELIDSENAHLFARRPGEVIISPVILSHMLAHAALRRELTSVFNELFGPGGAEIFFRPAADFGLDGRTISFREIRKSAFEHGEIALGVRIDIEEEGVGAGVLLNPAPGETWTLRKQDEILVLTHY